MASLEEFYVFLVSGITGITRGSPTTVYLGTFILLNFVEDEYFSDPANLQKAKLIFKPTSGRQLKVLTFDLTQETPSVQTKFPTAMTLVRVVLYDADGGSYSLKAADLPLTYTVTFANESYTFNDIYLQSSSVLQGQDIQFSASLYKNGSLDTYTGPINLKVYDASNVLYAVWSASAVNGLIAVSVDAEGLQAGQFSFKLNYMEQDSSAISVTVVAPTIILTSGESYASGTPTLTGTCNSYNTTLGFQNGASQGTAAVDGSGNWSFTVPQNWGWQSGESYSLRISLFNALVTKTITIQ